MGFLNHAKTALTGVKFVATGAENYIKTVTEKAFLVQQGEL